MDRDECIITVYCLVCEQYQVIKNTYPVRRGGFAPALSDEEVITLELCGEYFKLTTDKDLFAYFRAHYAHFFPPADGADAVRAPSCKPLARQSAPPTAADTSERAKRRPGAEHRPGAVAGLWLYPQ